MPFCPDCGSEYLQDPNYCVGCGRSLSPGMAARASGKMDYLISPQRLVTMVVLSYGVYLFYWFYLTWKHYRDHTGEVAFPIWHSLALIVPIYGWFRVHAHVRAYKELMSTAGLATTLSAGGVVAFVLLSIILDQVSLAVAGGFIADDLSQGEAVVSALLDLVSMTIVVGVLLHVQGNLNRYWTALADPELTGVRTGAGEVILAILGVLAWLGTLGSVFSESYRNV